MNSLGISKNDTVIVLSGKERGKKGKVLATQPKDGKVIVEGINIISKHTKPRRQGDPGGIIKKEAAILACKVMRVCPKCGEPTRIAHTFLEDGSKARFCKKCGETI